MRTIFRASTAILLGASLATACTQAPSEKDLHEQIENPKSGDVYVVRFRPQGGNEHRYYFYRVAAVRPTEVDLYPARQEATDSLADVSAPDFFANQPLTYTRAEALELLQEQPGDVQHARLVQVRR